MCLYNKRHVSWIFFFSPSLIFFFLYFGRINKFYRSAYFFCIYYNIFFFFSLFLLLYDFFFVLFHSWYIIKKKEFTSRSSYSLHKLIADLSLLKKKLFSLPYCRQKKKNVLKLDQITCGIGEENRLGTYMSRTLKHTDWQESYTQYIWRYSLTLASLRFFVESDFFFLFLMQNL